PMDFGTRDADTARAMAIAHTASPHFASRRHGDVVPMYSDAVRCTLDARRNGRRCATYPQIVLASLWISCASLR
ncbi:TPA: hypothetical protein ACT5CT_007274, partial [Burkholderia cenocepacia]